MKKPKAAAILTIHRPEEMTTAGVKLMIDWLEQQKKNLRQFHKQMSKRFTARYMYQAGK